MVTLQKDTLEFTFPEVHPDAELKIRFNRRIRLPENSTLYKLPRIKSRFPLRHADDYRDNLDPEWIKYSGVMLPMYQGDAMQISMISSNLPGRKRPYPFAVKIGCGEINALTGDIMDNALITGENQNFISVRDDEAKLNGYCTAENIVRQFTAAPLGRGFTAEEQLTGSAVFGGIQVLVYPMLRAAYDAYFAQSPESPAAANQPQILFQMANEKAMGLAPGGRLRNRLFIDSSLQDDWDIENTSRCFIHILNSESWKKVTGSEIPHQMINRDNFISTKIPWHDFYDDNTGSTRLNSLKVYPDETNTYYNSNAKDFFSATVSIPMDDLYSEFLSCLPDGSEILDAGCGSGRDLLYFKNRGYRVTGIDSSKELVKIASEYTGEKIICTDMIDIAFENRFDGIWACASLLHFKRTDFPAVLEKLSQALRQGGIIYMSFKYGDFEGLRGGRFFTDYTEESIALFLKPAALLEIIKIWKTSDKRKDKSSEIWLNCLIKKNNGL